MVWNIASRVQGVAETNGIAISQTVYNDIRNLKGLETEFLGEQQLKGVQGTIGVYKVWCSDTSILSLYRRYRRTDQPVALEKWNLGRVIIGRAPCRGYDCSIPFLLAQGQVPLLANPL